MTIAVTSMSAYNRIIDSLSERRKAVFNCILCFGPMTDKDISEHLGWPINRITGRRGELVDLGLVILDKIVIQDGFTAKSWRAVVPEVLF